MKLKHSMILEIKFFCYEQLHKYTLLVIASYTALLVNTYMCDYNVLHTYKFIIFYTLPHYHSLYYLGVLLLIVATIFISAYVYISS